MKIIQVIPAFRLAGAEIMCENLCIALKNAGETVIAVSLYSEQTAITERLRKNGVRIVTFKKKPGFDPTIFTKLIKLFREERPDVVHTHIYASKYALPVAILVGVKRRVHTVHSIAQKEQGSLGKIINKFMYHHCDVVPVALSNEVKKTISEVYGLHESLIPIVYNGIDLSKCTEKNSYETMNVFTVIHIGRFMKVKNHKILLQAFAKFVEKHENVKLQFLGEGELFDEMKEFAKVLGVEDKVEFLGLQSNVYPYLNKADIFCLPSEYEGVPMTLIEAMGTGLPIVASNVGGISDMLDNEKNALLVEPNDIMIEAAFEMLYSDIELRARLGRAAKIRSKAFSAKTMANEYIKIYKNRVEG